MKLQLDPMGQLPGTAAMSMFFFSFLWHWIVTTNNYYMWAKAYNGILRYIFMIHKIKWTHNYGHFTSTWNDFLTCSLFLIIGWLFSVNISAPQWRLWSLRLAWFLHLRQLLLLDLWMWSSGWLMDSVLSRAVWKVRVRDMFCAVSLTWLCNQPHCLCSSEDVAYTSFYVDSDYPVTKVLRDPVYVEVRMLERTDPNIVLTLGRCWATSDPYPHSVPQWDLLIDG